MLHSADASQFVYQGTFVAGKMHGNGQVEVPAVVGGRVGGAAAASARVAGSWEDGVFVASAPEELAALKTKVMSLPLSCREKWIGRAVRYPGGGVYCGEFNELAERHGAGRMTKPADRNGGNDLVVVHDGCWERDRPVETVE